MLNVKPATEGASRLGGDGVAMGDGVSGAVFERDDVEGMGIARKGFEGFEGVDIRKSNRHDFQAEPSRIRVGGQVPKPPHSFIRIRTFAFFCWLTKCFLEIIHRSWLKL
jgi:hypothetical protein